MTIIAATRKSMAADHFVTGGGVPYFSVKIFRHGDHIMGAAGNAAATTKWFEWMRRDCPPMEEIDLPGEDEDSFIGLVLNEDGLFVYNACCEPDKLLNEFYAVGSGSRYAMPILKRGGTPRAAVLEACEFSESCRVVGEPTVLTMKPKASKTKLKYQKTAEEAPPQPETPSV